MTKLSLRGLKDTEANKGPAQDLDIMDEDWETVSEWSDIEDGAKTRTCNADNRNYLPKQEMPMFDNSAINDARRKFFTDMEKEPQQLNHAGYVKYTAAMIELDRIMDRHQKTLETGEFRRMSRKEKAKWEKTASKEASDKMEGLFALHPTRGSLEKHQRERVCGDIKREDPELKPFPGWNVSIKWNSPFSSQGSQSKNNSGDAASASSGSFCEVSHEESESLDSQFEILNICKDDK
ncbi:hypothetical protein FALBO_14811 [Fusarium albosuccineum]|uniref:Uncharacterized protein n=1 Tax=Fusarium albosuccineum TaxID=1237068 RepID=A0A8H4P450_9HYPO|nr:hypothetical protein FALBO_14811 [Fusarium albosuccineum]